MKCNSIANVANLVHGLPPDRCTADAIPRATRRFNVCGGTTVSARRGESYSGIVYLSHVVSLPLTHREDVKDRRTAEASAFVDHTTTGTG